MNKLVASILLLPSLAIAQTTIDLGDLDIASSRVPQWYPATTAEASYASAQSWPEYDVTCECADDSCVADSAGSGCTPYTGTIAFPNSWTCTPADPADDGGEDWDNIDCLIDAVPDSSVVFIPDGVYDMSATAGLVITINKNNVVVRGESNTGTHIIATTHDGTNLVSSQADGRCDNVDYCRSGIFSIGSAFGGTTTPWTAGYEEFATSITVTSTAGMSVNGWILLEMTSCAALLNQTTGPTDDSLDHIAKITNISGSVVTIDRGLRMDYDDDGCEGTAVASPYTPHSGIGIENMHLTTDTVTVTQGNIGALRGAVGMGGIVESWVVGNDIERFEDEVMGISHSARNWVQGNKFHDFCYLIPTDNYNTEGIGLDRGAVDNVIENNYITDYCLASKSNGGVEGTVFGYNYMPGGTAPGGRFVDRSLFNHGMYNRESLWEGNHTDAQMLAADDWWGHNGPRITVFRNRVTGTGVAAGIVTDDAKGGGWLSNTLLNIIGNTAHWYIQTPLCTIDAPDCYGSAHDIDARSTDMWIEKNIYRNTTTCADDPTTGRCGFHMDTAEATTQCGTALCSAASTDPGDNYGGDSRGANMASQTIPHSLYRTTAPSWWCSEAETCVWDDVYNGIGAWGDDVGGTLCKLPAQIMAEAGTCTALVAGPKSVFGLGLSGVSRGQQ